MEKVDKTIFTKERIANCRKAKGGVWVFPSAKAALDEIECLQIKIFDSLSRAEFDEAIIRQLISIGNEMSDEFDGDVYLEWKRVVSMWSDFEEQK